ncbi:myosin light chain kinase, smooth muscle-like isoform X1 [Anopheles darlingi]|uniref:myosin light chain kinase, smooth muscle-like isoform X1 n=2 Tax=Anopheles darlingi TaxID=43151 RepID=UPI0021005FE3|nr:myosin light chain kinase, smooth muscle-like isoform X1 [Anopheles darlingi]XP_049533994.1 myosin light chain kinase, smooth muscle-like isoform X1 [Anopheles darlingi]XP_049533995.1 myosin light chain kinase, smooth muscle-like isoform X1 [Anopheles darlingi]XP_049533996.1 myosin light chain kinase, smooth muscle-like isoform X1 [Anopheles darlingi]
MSVVGHGGGGGVPPQVTKLHRTIRCTVGEEFRLECDVRGSPTPRISWEKDGVRVITDGTAAAASSAGQGSVAVFSGTRATLKVASARRDQTGSYRCVAENAHGTAAATVHVFVVGDPRDANGRTMMLTTKTAAAPNEKPISEEAQSNSGTVPLKFIYVPQKIEAYEYETAVFQCIIEGYPTPRMSWQRNGRPLNASRNISIQSKGSLCTMKLQNVTPKDAGPYQLVIENDNGRVERTIELLVLEKIRTINRIKRNSVPATSGIRIYRHINDYAPRVGEYILLNAEYYAPSIPSVRCFHNGREVDDGRIFHRSVSQRNLSLILEKAKPSDSGTYTCILETIDGCIKVMSAEIDIQEAGRAGGPIDKIARVVRELPKVITVTEGNEVELTLELHCPELFKFVWKKNGRPIKDSVDFAYIDHGNGILGLRLKDPFLDDAGLYECIIETGKQQLTATCYLDVLELEPEPTENGQPAQCTEVTGAKFLRFPLSQIAIEGDNVEVYACIQPTPDIRLRWYVRGTEITSASKGFSIESRDDGYHTLRIFNAGYKQSGEVKCSLFRSTTDTSVAAAVTSAYADLCVLPKAYASAGERKEIERYSGGGQKLRFLHGLQDEVVLQGDDVIIEACFQGQPLSQLRWKRSDRYIMDGNATTCNLPGRTRLLLKSIEAAQGGRYSVQLDSAAPETLLSMCLRVESPPEPPAGRPTVTTVAHGTTALSVSWNAAPYDGGSAITGFVIEVERYDEGQHQWTCVKRVPNSYSCVVDNLEPAYRYRFRIRAENVHGSSNPTPASEPIAPVADYTSATESTVAAATNGNVSSGGGGSGRTNRPAHKSPASSGASICSSIGDGGELTIGSGPMSSDGSGHIEEDTLATAPSAVSSIVFPVDGVFAEQFEVVKEVGKGRFGVVYKVVARGDGTVLAAKKVKCILKKDKERVWQETAIMQGLEHPKLLRLYATYELPKEIIMVIEYISGGELFERVVADDFTLTEKDCIIFVRQICQGVEHMHSRQIVHLDLKPENIMCATKTSHEIKIIDFGLAQQLCASTPTRVLFGTPEFIAPEIINYEPISVLSDMWSIGVICYVLLSGLSPFMGDNDVDTFSNITRAEYDFDDEAFDLVSDEAKEFIAGLLRGRQEERLSARECLESGWLSLKDGDTVGVNQIRTDKLKKFIIRRKWQKTGNAIRALGRMANLSASRRVSVIPRDAANNSD